MSRYSGPRLRILRRLGTPLPGLTAKSAEKRAFPPGQHGPRTRRKDTLYGRRLREKQKLRYHYGVTERQLRVLAARAVRSRSNAAAELARLLEQRIDNIIFRAGFARTIPAARQLVGHGHVLLNGRALDIASARVRTGDILTLSQKGQAVVRASQSLGQVLQKPEWLDVDDANLTVRVTSLPGVEGVPFPVDIGLVVEFYS